MTKSKIVFPYNFKTVKRSNKRDPEIYSYPVFRGGPRLIKTGVYVKYEFDPTKWFRWSYGATEHSAGGASAGAM